MYFTPKVLASGPSGPFTWFGTLAEFGAGSAGLLYKRNRYFDPASGRFTQADPIGLGGGLNLYGFANGDPVIYTDPLGLCPNGPIPCEQLGLGIGGALGAGLGGIGAVACAGSTFGICSAGAPFIVGAASGLGATLGGLAGKAIDFIHRSDKSWEGLTPEELRGKSAEEVDAAVPGDWVREPSTTGGTRIKHPRNCGEQIRIQPGKPTDRDPVKRGPYCRISCQGNTSDPIPLKGNPTLPR